VALYPPLPEPMGLLACYMYSRALCSIPAVAPNFFPEDARRAAESRCAPCPPGVLEHLQACVHTGGARSQMMIRSSSASASPPFWIPTRSIFFRHASHRW